MGNYLIQMVMGCIGAVGFSVLFNVREDKLPLIAAASAISWLVYAACLTLGTNLFWATFLGTLMAGLISEIFARVVKAPVLMLLVPILIPLIPGGSLYYTMSYAVLSQWSQVKSYGASTAYCALGIAVGMSIVLSVEYTGNKLLKRK